MVKKQFTVIGDHVNTSSRLCDAAGPREIIISENNEKLLSDNNFKLKKLNPIKVKGKEEPIQIYRIRL